LIVGAEPAPLHHVATPPELNLEPDLMYLVESRARQAGLKLDEAQSALLFSAAPYALAMSERVRAETRAWDLEPATTFRPVG
jgi:hypothetical protein